MDVEEHDDRGPDRERRALEHRPKRRGQQERTGGVHREVPRDRGRIERLERRGFIDARVVDEPVERHVGEACREIRDRVGRIEMKLAQLDVRLAIGHRDRGDGLEEAFGAAGAREDKVAAASRELDGDLAADAAAGSGDEHARSAHGSRTPRRGRIIRSVRLGRHRRSRPRSRGAAPDGGVPPRATRRSSRRASLSRRDRFA